MERDAMGRQTGIQTDNRRKHSLRQIIPRGNSSVWWSLSAGVECPPSPHWDPPSQSQCPESWRSQMSRTYKEKTQKKNKGGVNYITLLARKIAPQDNTIILGKECKNSDYTVERFCGKSPRWWSYEHFRFLSCCWLPLQLLAVNVYEMSHGHHCLHLIEVCDIK